MRIRAGLLAMVLGGMLVAPLVATSHTKTLACHSTDRVVTTVVDADVTIYFDDRGQLQSGDVPPEAQDAWGSLPPDVQDATGYDRVPGAVRGEDASGTWIYLEDNGHPGLQTGGEHVVLGNNDPSFIDTCKDDHAGAQDIVMF